METKVRRGEVHFALLEDEVTLVGTDVVCIFPRFGRTNEKKKEKAKVIRLAWVWENTQRVTPCVYDVNLNSQNRFSAF
jgi:hypothetical protein